MTFEEVSSKALSTSSKKASKFNKGAKSLGLIFLKFYL